MWEVTPDQARKCPKRYDGGRVSRRYGCEGRPRLVIDPPSALKRRLSLAPSRTEYQLLSLCHRPPLSLQLSRCAPPALAVGQGLRSSSDPRGLSSSPGFGHIILNSAVAGLKMAHLTKITLSFEFSVLTLTVPGLRLRKVQNTSCF